MSKHRFTVQGEMTCLDGIPFLAKGVRCSNALISDAAADQLIENLSLFASYGVNTISVFLQGSRFGDVKGYRQDAALDPVYAARMGRIIEAADARAMVVLAGCLYWGNSKAKWENWTQTEANAAVRNTAAWLCDRDYRNVIVDVDNEGMALRGAGFDNRQMVIAGKEADRECIIGTNFKGHPPPEADLALHFAHPVPGKPYIQSEGSPTSGLPLAVPGGYWGPYSKQDGLYQYVNIGVYTKEMKASQIADARAHFERGHGYMLAATWLQAAPPEGPNHCPGGNGTRDDPGIRWWLEWLTNAYGPYKPEDTR